MSTREIGEADPLHAILREGVRELIAKGVEAALGNFLEGFAEQRLEAGRQALVRKRVSPECKIQTGISEVEIRVLNGRERSCIGASFNLIPLPLCLKKLSTSRECPPGITRTRARCYSAIRPRGCRGIASYGSSSSGSRSTWLVPARSE